MQKGRRKLNQAGMTLVELIVVIVILGILSAGAAVGINYVSRMDSTSAGEKLVSLLERTRVYTISANGTVTLELKKDGNTYYGILKNSGTEVDKVSLGNGSLSIELTEPGVAGNVTVSDSVTPVIAYKKANGAFEDSCTYSSIIISGSKTRTIQLVHATGRSYLK